jgi:hypothetical protein
MSPLERIRAVGQNLVKSVDIMLQGETLACNCEPNGCGSYKKIQFEPCYEGR